MKALSFFLLLLALSSNQIQSQEAQPSKAALAVQTDKTEKKGGELMAITKPKISGKADATKVSYGGLLVDLANAEKSAKPVYSRTPPSPKKEDENLYTEPRTGKPRGFILFAIKF
jgi:hypothetical protein